MPICSHKTLYAALFAVSLSIETVCAGDLESQPRIEDFRSGWTVHATPYAWLPFLDGQSIIRGRTTDIDLRPIQVLEHLDAVPWMSYVELRNGPLTLYNDIFYANLGASSGGIRVRDFAGAGAGSLGGSAALDFEQLVIELGGAYEVTRWQHGAAPTSTAIDVLAGARYWRQKLTVGIDIGASVDIPGFEISGDRAFARSGTVDWVDPLVGFKIRHGLLPGHDIIFRADIGGFDVGSELSWNLVGAYSFDLTVRDGAKYTGMVGYRLLDVDYTKGSDESRYEYDVLQHGPIMGLTVTF